MSVNVGNKSANLVNVIHLNGLEHVDITDADVKTGKVSISKYGDKIIGNSTQRYLENNTSDATALAEDINIGKTLWVGGALITGTHTQLTPNLAVRGVGISYTVASGNTITTGDFVKLIGSNVGKVTTNTDKILGIATTGGSSGSTITVKVPF